MATKGIGAMIAEANPPSKLAESDDSWLTEDEDLEVDEEDEAGLDVAVEDIMSAIDTKDPAMLKAALRAFLDLA